MSCSTGSCNGSVGNSGYIDPSQVSQRVGPQGEQTVQSTGCADGSCGPSPSTGSANGSCSGGSCGSKAAYQRAGCSDGSCSSKAAKASGSCGTGGCDEGAGGKKAQKSDCSNGQCDGKKGLFKATIMTVAASELSQLTIDYSQYLS